MENLYALDLRIPTIHNIVPLLSPTPTPTQTPTPTPTPSPASTIIPSPTQTQEIPTQTQTEIITPSPLPSKEEKAGLDFWQITTIILLTAILTGFLTTLILGRKKKEKE